MLPFSDQLIDLQKKALAKTQPLFSYIDEIALQNTCKILAAFRTHKVSEHHFHPSTGYGYDDIGRIKLEEVWAEIFHAEKALVRTQFASGTHALSTVLFGILRPGDELLSITGTPYDTMQTVIGHIRDVCGSLKDWNIQYREIPMIEEGINLSAMMDSITAKTAMVLIQRSRGYSLRKPLSIKEITEACHLIKSRYPQCICFVDNCYGEFVETLEPTAVGADIMAGSLIKNPGGGLAFTGGYVAGKTHLVEKAAHRLTAPGVGGDIGSNLVGNRLFFQGLFQAPHVTAQALKTAVFSAALFSEAGFKTIPLYHEPRYDIIQAIQLDTAEKMVAFCKGLQGYSPVDSYVSPEPGPMPGYHDPVIMAGGTFIQGSSIELSADGPLRSPYTIYQQGALTIEHGMLGVMGALAEIMKIS